MLIKSHGLVEARGGGGADDDVLGDLGKPQVVVDRPAHEVGGVDDPLLQGRVHLPAGEEDRGDAGGAVDIGDDPARVPDLLPLEVLEGADGDLGVDQVVVVLDRPEVHHVVLPVGLAGDLPAPEDLIPGVPLVGTVHGEGVGGEEGGHGDLAGPVDVKAVVGVENARFHGVEHLEGPDDGARGETFDQELPLGHLGHLLAEVLELGVAHRAGVPAGLHLPLDRGRRVQAHHPRETHDTRRGAGRNRCGLQETAT